MTLPGLPELLDLDPPPMIGAEALEPLETEGPFDRFHSTHPARSTVTYTRWGDVFVREMEW